MAAKWRWASETKRTALSRMRLPEGVTQRTCLVRVPTRRSRSRSNDRSSAFGRTNEMRGERDGSLAAEAEAVLVVRERGEQRSRPLTDAERAAFEREALASYQASKRAWKAAHRAEKG